VTFDSPSYSDCGCANKYYWLGKLKTKCSLRLLLSWTPICTCTSCLGDKLRKWSADAAQLQEGSINDIYCANFMWAMCRWCLKTYAQALADMAIESRWMARQLRQRSNQLKLREGAPDSSRSDNSSSPPYLDVGIKQSKSNVLSGVQPPNHAHWGLSRDASNQSIGHTPQSDAPIYCWAAVKAS
jgi:hypothetical protein